MSSRPALADFAVTPYATTLLSKVADVFTDGDWIETKDQAESGIRLVQTGNVGCGEYKDRADKARFIDKETFDRLKCFEVLPGDILISRLPDPVGRACIVPDIGQKMITAVDCSIVRLKQGAVDPRFFSYYTQTHEYLRDVDSRCTGTTRRRISRKNLGQVSVPLPPLDEQKQIVAVLDQAFAAFDRARVNAEANLADAQELFVSELREKFRQASIGNARLSFDQLCDTLTPSIKIKRADYLDEGNYPIVSQEAESVSGYWNDPGALLGIERPVVVFGDHTRCLKYIDFDFVVGADGTKIMQPESGISAGYLYFGLRSQPVPEDGYARHFKFVRERTLPDISFREQEDLAQALFDIEEKCKGLEASYQTKLADIAALRQSLLQQAFAGEL